MLAGMYNTLTRMKLNIAPPYSNESIWKKKKKQSILSNNGQKNSMHIISSKININLQSHNIHI